MNNRYNSIKEHVMVLFQKIHRVMHNVYAHMRGQVCFTCAYVHVYKFCTIYAFSIYSSKVHDEERVIFTVLFESLPLHFLIIMPTVAGIAIKSVATIRVCRYS